MKMLLTNCYCFQPTGVLNVRPNQQLTASTTITKKCAKQKSKITISSKWHRQPGVRSIDRSTGLGIGRMCCSLLAVVFFFFATQRRPTWLLASYIERFTGALTNEPCPSSSASLSAALRHTARCRPAFKAVFRLVSNEALTAATQSAATAANQQPTMLWHLWQPVTYICRSALHMCKYVFVWFLSCCCMPHTHR